MSFANYLHESGLNDDPFADAEDGELFFATPQLSQRLDLLQHLVLYSDLVLAVTGPPGSGKTTLLNRLISLASQPWRVSVVQAHVEMDVPQFLAKAKQGFDLLGAGLSIIDQVDQLKKAAEAWRAGSQTPVLVVDEAHLLPPDTLTKLVQFAPGMNDAGLRILLLGEPQLGEKLTAAAAHAPGGNVMHLVDMPAFTQSQATEYLQYRVRRSGLDAAMLFPDDVAKGLYKGSYGLPGRLNADARNLLADRLERTQRDARPVPSSGSRFAFFRRGPGLAIEAALLLALVGAFWLAIRGDSGPPPQAIALPPLPESRNPPKTSYEPRGQEPQPASVQVSALEESRSAGVEELNAVAEPLVEPLVPLKPQGPLQSVKAGEPAKAAPTMQEQEGPPTSVEPIEPTVAPAASSQGALVASSPGPIQHLETAGLVALSSNIVQETPAGPGKGELRDESWLLAQPPSHYTLQLAASHDPAAAISFVTTHELQGQAAWFRTLHEGRDWYVVVSGSYSTRDAALQAMRQLSASLRRQGPWTRSFASIQASIAQSRSAR